MAVVEHVGAMAKRGEYRSIEEARQAGNGKVPTEAILADRPIYKTGQILRPPGRNVSSKHAWKIIGCTAARVF
jgi:hypothetical protein